MFTVAVLFAASLIPIDRNRPAIDVTVENVMEAVASPDPDAMKRLMDRVHKSPDAKSQDFHSFVFEKDGLHAYLWPRECVSYPQLRTRSPLIFTSPMHSDVYVAGPYAQVVPKGGRCLLSLAIYRNEKVYPGFVLSNFNLSDAMLTDLVSENETVRKATRSKLAEPNRATSRTGYPVAWSDINEYSAHFQFESSKKCLTRQWFTALGYSFEEPGYLEVTAMAKGTKRPPLSFAFDPQRPQCISAVITQ